MLKNIKTLIIGLIILSLVVLDVYSFKANYELKKQIIKLEQIIEKVVVSKENTETSLNVIEDSDLILKKHMQHYIKQRFTKTPKVIAKEISKNIIRYANKYDLPPELILGIIEIESSFNPLVQSSKGARGLMQVMPEWVPKMGLKDVNELHEIETGIDTGIKVFLIHLEEANGSISGGLYRYVNKDHSYVEKVYSSVGRFVAYRSTINDQEILTKEENK